MLNLFSASKPMTRILPRLIALTLAVVVSVTTLLGFAGTAAADGLSGNYKNDTLSLVETLRNAISLPDGTPDKAKAQGTAKQLITDFFSRYRRDPNATKLTSFTTMRTALNSLAGHYASYPNRPVPQKLKDRLELEFSQVEAAVNRGG
jgi:photosystem II Psb27 protein